MDERAEALHARDHAGHRVALAERGLDVAAQGSRPPAIRSLRRAWLGQPAAATEGFTCSSSASSLPRTGSRSGPQPRANAPDPGRARRGSQRFQPSDGTIPARPGLAPRARDLVEGFAALRRGRAVPRSAIALGVGRPTQVATTPLVSRRPALRSRVGRRPAGVPRFAVPDCSLERSAVGASRPFTSGRPRRPPEGLPTLGPIF